MKAIAPPCRARVAATVLALAAWAAGQQHPPSDPAALFEPGARVPLSEFVTALQGRPVLLHVRPEILSWLAAHGAPAKVVLRTPSGQVDDLPELVDVAAGTVAYTPGVDADLVVVSDALRNDFPIVTHWNAAANAQDGFGGLPRGGQEPGAVDGIGLLDYNPHTGKLSPSGGSALNNVAADGHAHGTAGPYWFATHRYALFSDGTETTDVRDGEPADADVPTFERYVGENWALTAVTNLAAVWLSDRSRAHSGLPVAHRNHPTAFQASAPATRQLQPDLPVLQVVHAFIVEFDDPAVVGSENSLATFLVPPGWTPTPAKPYPVLFNSFYDIHSSTFATMGDVFLRTLGDLYALDGRQAVGILSNGGGAGVAHTLQASAYPNAYLLFREAWMKLAIDRTNVVVVGGSRGGSAGLALSANPFVDAYTARYIVAGNPQTHPGSALQRFANPTYWVVQTGVASASGYQLAWKEDWTDPHTGRTGKAQAAYVLFGLDDFAQIDAQLANGSPPFVAKLAEKGTNVILRLGTHDHTKSFSHMTRYMEALEVAGVRNRVELGYRLGHGNAVGTEPDERTLLNWVIDGVDPLATGHFLLHPVTEQDEQEFTAVEFTAPQAPLFVEAPMLAGMNQRHTITVTGPPGARFEIWPVQIDETLWTQGVIQNIGPHSMRLTGVLPTAPVGVPMTSSVLDVVPPYHPAAEGPWLLECRYSLDGGQSWRVLNGETSSPPPALGAGNSQLAWLEDLEPVVYLNAIDPADSQVVGLDVASRTGGMSEDSEY